ncbi:MAG: GAF domain-containing protein [Phycisphaerales bacterium]|nr:GAF domain-containing protein [Phycisphaerales bacterium]
MSESPNSNRLTVNEPLNKPLFIVATNESWAADLLRSSLTLDIVRLEIIRRDDQSFQRLLRDAPSVIAVELSGLGTHGFDLLRALASHADTEHIPCIAMAILPDPLIRAAALAASAEEFISRLSEPEEVLSRVNTLAKLGMSKLSERMAETEIASLQQRLNDREHSLRDRERLLTNLEMSSALARDLHKKRIKGLVEISNELNKVQDFDELMHRILSGARALIGADAGTVYIYKNKILQFQYTQNDTIDGRKVGIDDSKYQSKYQGPVSENSIAGWVGVSGECVNIANAYSLEPSCQFQFDKSFDLISVYKTQSVLALPLRTSLGHIVGVLQLINAKDSEERATTKFTDSDQSLLSHFASMATVAIERTQHHESIIKKMLRMLQTHDPIETSPHSERLAGISGVLFEEWYNRRGLEGAAFQRQRDRLRHAARLHDVGKIGVTDLILKKPSKLNAAEYAEVKKHVIYGARLFLDPSTEFDESSRDVVLNHHERWDGGGYPGYVDFDGKLLVDPITHQSKHGGKKGEDIPLFARVVALADVFDALSNERCYKKAWPERRVLDTIRGEAGKQFDPELVDIFFAKLSDIRDIRRQHTED